MPQRNMDAEKAVLEHLQAIRADFYELRSEVEALREQQKIMLATLEPMRQRERGTGTVQPQR